MSEQQLLLLSIRYYSLFSSEDEAPKIMPKASFKYTFLEADTRPLELILSAFSLFWGLWIVVVSQNPYTGSFWGAVAQYGGPALWSTWAVINGLFQVNSIWYKYPSLRRHAASVSAVYWDSFGLYCVGQH